AKAPVAGFAKTRLVPVLGVAGAAELQARLTAHTVATACAAAVGPVTVWATPDETHPSFQILSAEPGVAPARPGDGALGERMLAAVVAAAGPCLVIGTDCPVLTAAHICGAADILRSHDDVVVIPADDGGYVLIGMRRPHPELFSAMRWSTHDVMDETR